MTDGQKSQINELRTQGIGYMKIAGIVGVSVNTIKSYCRKIERTSVVPVCEQCGMPIDKSLRGNRRFCSDTCRMKWWNAHPKQELPYTSICACCGKVIHTRRKNERKFCSHDCYIRSRFKEGAVND